MIDAPYMLTDSPIFQVNITYIVGRDGNTDFPSLLYLNISSCVKRSNAYK